MIYKHLITVLLLGAFLFSASTKIGVIPITYKINVSSYMVFNSYIGTKQAYIGLESILAMQGYKYKGKDI